MKAEGEKEEGLQLMLLEQQVSSEIQLCKCDKRKRDIKRWRRKCVCANREKKELLGATCFETAGYSLCAEEEACAFPHACCTQLRYGVTALKNKYTLYSVNIVLSTWQMIILVSNHRFFHNIKLLKSKFTMRFPLIFNLEIQSPSGIIFHVYQICF